MNTTVLIIPDHTVWEQNRTYKYKREEWRKEQIDDQVHYNPTEVFDGNGHIP